MPFTARRHGDPNPLAGFRLGTSPGDHGNGTARGRWRWRRRSRVLGEQPSWYKPGKGNSRYTEKTQRPTPISVPRVCWGTKALGWWQKDNRNPHAATAKTDCGWRHRSGQGLGGEKTVSWVLTSAGPLHGQWQGHWARQSPRPGDTVLPSPSSCVRTTGNVLPIHSPAKLAYITSGTARQCSCPRNHFGVSFKINSLLVIYPSEIKPHVHTKPMSEYLYRFYS